MASETHHLPTARLNGPNEGAYGLLAAPFGHTVTTTSTVIVKAIETVAARLAQ